MSERSGTRKYTSDIAFSAKVKEIQERKGSRQSYGRMEQTRGWADRVTPELAEFLAQRDSFYLGSASADGQPYIQHRGGKPGFLKVLDDRTLAFADFVGNRQYISQGNFAENPRAFIFLMDYPNRRRIKIWGRVRVVEGEDELLARVLDEDYPGRPEQVMLFDVEAWDANCPQHIQPRFTEAEVQAAVAPLHQRIADLERKLAERE